MDDGRSMREVGRAGVSIREETVDAAARKDSRHLHYQEIGMSHPGPHAFRTWHPSDLHCNYTILTAREGGKIM